MTAQDMMAGMQHQLEYAFLSQRFFTFGQIGGLLVVLTSFDPFFAPYNLLGLVSVLAVITWDLWRSAGKGVRSVLAWIVLLAGLTLAVLVIGEFVHPVTADQVSADFQTSVPAGVETMIIGAVARVGAALGQVFLIIGGLFGVLAARRAPATH